MIQDTSEPVGARSRARVDVRLIGGAHADGEVPLDVLASIGRHLQQLLRRLGRQASDRAGAGRTPEELRRLTGLLLVGLRDGSTTLEFAGPPLEVQFELDVAKDAGMQALDRLLEVLAAMAQPEPRLPEDMAAPAAESLRALVGSLTSYAEVEVAVSRADRSDRVELRPNVAARALAGRRQPGDPEVPAAVVRQVAGKLYALNLHTGRFQIEDDLGATIDLSVPGELQPVAQRLAGRAVVASGTAFLDARGRLRVDVFGIEPEDLAVAVDFQAFRASNDLDDLLADATPLRSLDDLAIDGLTQEEAAAFLAALA